MMLLTFSRRAAAEMQRRVERITAKVFGPKAGVMTDALARSGTFHAIGARLLREYALEIGLDTAFTIHDREDSPTSAHCHTTTLNARSPTATSPWLGNMSDTGLQPSQHLESQSAPQRNPFRFSLPMNHSSPAELDIGQ